VHPWQSLARTDSVVLVKECECPRGLIYKSLSYNVKSPRKFSRTAFVCYVYHVTIQTNGMNCRMCTAVKNWHYPVINKQCKVFSVTVWFNSDFLTPYSNLRKFDPCCSPWIGIDLHLLRVHILVDLVIILWSAGVVHTCRHGLVHTVMNAEVQAAERWCPHTPQITALYATVTHNRHM